MACQCSFGRTWEWGSPGLSQWPSEQPPPSLLQLYHVRARACVCVYVCVCVCTGIIHLPSYTSNITSPNAHPPHHTPQSCGTVHRTLLSTLQLCGVDEVRGGRPLEAPLDSHGQAMYSGGRATSWRTCGTPPSSRGLARLPPFPGVPPPSSTHTVTGSDA